MTITRDDVRDAYHSMLGREPENETVIERRLGHASVATLRAEIAASSEYLTRAGRRSAAPPRAGLITDEEVAAVYGAMLGRAPENALLGEEYRRQMMTAVDLMLFVMRSEEFRRTAGPRFSAPTPPPPSPEVAAPAGHPPMRAEYAMEPRLLPLYMFLHIPKTGGTSLNRVFDRMFRSQVLYTSPIDLDRRVKTEADFFHRFLLVTGHIDVNNPAALRSPRPTVFLAVFRDPVKRAISLYDYARATPDHPLHGPLQSVTLAEAFRSLPAFRHVTGNAQLRTVFGTANGTGLRDALRRRSYILGRHDALEAFVDAVALYSGLPRPPFVPRLNTAEDVQPAEPATTQPDIAEAIEALTQANRAEQRFIDEWLDRPFATVGCPTAEESAPQAP